MIKLCEEFLLIHHRVDTSLLDDAAFVHLFHGVELLLLFFLHFPDLAETASANHIVEHKVILIRR